jgi:hypothetical protein
VIQRINSLWRQYTIESICAILAVGIVAFMLIDHAAGGDTTSASPAQQLPTSLATGDAFPSPGKTIEVTHTVHLKDGSIATETVRSYKTIRADGKTQLVRETVSETARGVRVTRTAKATTVVRVPGTNSVVTVPGTNSVVTVPGTNSTTTAVATETVTVPGPTVTIPGPDTTVRVTATASVPGPTVTVTATESVPGPTVTVTQCPQAPC